MKRNVKMFQGVYAAIFCLFATLAFGQEDASYDGMMLVNNKGTELQLGTRHYGAYLNGRISVGSLELSIAPVRKHFLEVRTDWKMNVSGASFSRVSTARLGRSLELVDWREAETEGMGGATTHRFTRLRLAGKNWVGEQSYKGGKVRAGLKAEGQFNYGTLESLVAMAPVVAKAPPGIYRFSEILNRLGLAPSPELLAWGYFDIQVHESSEYVHRGTSEKVRVVRAIWNAEKATSLVVSEAGVLLAFWVESVPLQFVLGNKEEVGLHLPIAEGVVRDSDPRAAIQTLFEVMVGERTEDALDEVIDWSGVIRRLGELANEAAIEDFKARVKLNILEKTPPFAKEDIPLLIGMLDVVRGEDEVRVNMEGRDEPFILEQRDDKWWIVGLPQ